MEPKTELQKNAIAASRRAELNSFQRALDVKWMNDRMEDGRMGRCLALIQREAKMEKDFQERTDHAAVVNACADKETDLGLEIAITQHNDACELLRRHYLRERDPELRALMKKLQAGYICRDLQLQIKNKEYKQLQDKAQENHANSILQNALYNNQEFQEKEELEKLKRTTEYRHDLQQQLVNKEQQKRCIYEDTLIEKKMLEDIMRVLADEDQRELAHKRETKERIRNEMLTFQSAREAWKKKQKELVIQEERELEKQIASAADRSSAIIAEREQKRQEKEAANEKISAKILAEEAERRKRENIIKSLQEQEHLEKNLNDEIVEKQKNVKSKEDTKQALMAQMQNRLKFEREQKNREARLREEVAAKIAADLQRDKEKLLEKRLKGRQYSEELLKQIQANQVKRERDRQMENERDKRVFDWENDWKKEVSKERELIIKEHVPPLLGYLQSGVITKKDIPAVIEGASTNPDLAKLNIHAMANSNRPQRFSKCNAQCRVIREY